MRLSIKLVSVIITLIIFVLLNIYWFIIVPPGSTYSTDDPAYYLVLVGVLGALVAIFIFFYNKNRQKTKLKI